MHPADGRVVSNFIMQALRNEPITIYGDGSQTRSFCYVDDLVRGLHSLMETGPDVTGRSTSATRTSSRSASLRRKSSR
nr:NAD-dependent epimerase/dehydratase family protein [Sphingomonas daechungensis]